MVERKNCKMELHAERAKRSFLEASTDRTTEDLESGLGTLFFLSQLKGKLLRDFEHEGKYGVQIYS